jgi:hypothetical protein
MELIFSLKKDFIMKKLLGLLLLSTSFASQAQIFDITINDCGGLSTTQCSQIENELEDSANADLPDVSLSKYADGIANSVALAPKGLDTDYANDFDLFLVGVGGGLAVDGDLSKPESASGVGFNGAILAGVPLKLLPVKKLGPVDLNKAQLFFSFFSYSLNQKQDESEFTGKLNTMGAHVRYQLVDPKTVLPGYMLQWGGVHLHTGFQISKNKLGVESSIPDTETELDGAPGTTASFENGTAEFTIDTSTTSIPVELSTYARFLYVFTLYGGVGMDFNSGKTDIDFESGGDIVGSGLATGLDANASLDESESGKVKGSWFRYFAGLQFNIPFVRLYAQLQKAGDVQAVQAGLKILY